MEVSALAPGALVPDLGQGRPGEEKPAASFSEMLCRALEEINARQQKADELARTFAAGEIEDVHQVVIAMQEAKLLLQLAVEVRNKAVEAYQEISRMQV